MHEYCIQFFEETYVLDVCLESPQWGDSNKYPKHMFYEEKTKQDLPYISICSLSILYNRKFI